MKPKGATDVRMYLRMTAGALGLSLRRLVWTPSILAHIGIAAVPLFIVAMMLLASWHHPFSSFGMMRVHATYEWFLRLLFLHFVVFFIANILGSSVMRQEREEQTLHYLFLQPVRRWMLIVGKLGAYLITATVICVASLWLTYLALGLWFCGVDAVVTDLFQKGRAVILIKESLVLVLGLLAYGSFALLMGNFFKNATYSLILLGWEAGLPYLPSTLKFWTVMHYLQSLLPERPLDQNKIFELLGESASMPMSLAVLIAVPCVFIAFSIYIFRYRECMYGET